MESPRATDPSSNVSPRIDYSDYLILGSIALLTALWYTKGKLWAVKKVNQVTSTVTPKYGSNRDIIQKMRSSDKNTVVFYGSQTGTAEDYATRLAKEGHQKYGLKTMTADLEEYDYDTLDQFPPDFVAIFVLATYGEGEPTDNAVPFFDFLRADEVAFSEPNDPSAPLENLKYVAFGLGNKTYEHYNEMIKVCDKILTSQGAKRIGSCGMGDDGDGTMEEDFISWKEDMWSQLASELNLEERETVYEASLDVVEDTSSSLASASVFLGEPSKKYLTRVAKPFNANNPFLAPISAARELFTTKDRNCMHIELDLTGASMKYRTGDHVAVIPMNPENEVERLLKVLGLSEKRTMPISIKPLDSTAKVPIPQPTTYLAALTHYLEICGPVSRQFMTTLQQFCPDDQAQAEVIHLSQDKEYFIRQVSKPHLNLGQLMESISTKPWPLPFTAILESIGRLQPRYYSISSSSAVSPQQLTITAVVESKTFAGHHNVLNGVTTNYLLALAQHKNGVTDPHPYGARYSIEGPRQLFAGCKVPIYVRQSNFKLPNDPTTPIVMVGPGTGVAPFRGFLQERLQQARSGITVGKSLLFFGCRRAAEDFIYKAEWEIYKKELGDAFEIDVAFSREGPNKVYVQDRLAARGDEVKAMLQTGNFYLCGDAAGMAKDVNNQLLKLIGETEFKTLKSKQRHQEDVWS